MMFFVYQLIYFMLLPFVFLRLWIRGMQSAGYRLRWKERLGWVPFQLKDCLVVHAVSMGEVVAASSLIDCLRLEYPNTPIVVTTMTPSGSAQVNRLWPNQEVYHCYLPYDLLYMLQRFFDALSPKLFILMETELWPGLVQVCRRCEVPLALVNGRLSERSYLRYRKISAISKLMLSGFERILVQNEDHQRRFLALGASDKQVLVTGSIKFDVVIKDKQHQVADSLRSMWSDRLVWIAASTHAHEENMVLALYQELRAKIPDLLLVWASMTSVKPTI